MFAFAFDVVNMSGVSIDKEYLIINSAFLVVISKVNVHTSRHDSVNDVS